MGRPNGRLLICNCSQTILSLQRKPNTCLRLWNTGAQHPLSLFLSLSLSLSLPLTHSLTHSITNSLSLSLYEVLLVCFFLSFSPELSVGLVYLVSLSVCLCLLHPVLLSAFLFNLIPSVCLFFYLILPLCFFTVYSICLFWFLTCLPVHFSIYLSLICSISVFP